MIGVKAKSTAPSYIFSNKSRIPCATRWRFSWDVPQVRLSFFLDAWFSDKLIEGGKLGIGASTVCKGIEDQPELKATSKMSDYQFVIDDFAAMVGDRLISAPEVSKTPNTMIAPELALNQVSEYVHFLGFGRQ